MMMWYVFIILSICVFYLYHNLGRKQKVPSGLKDIPTETGVPVLGVIHKIRHSLANYLLILSHKHGPIFRIKFGRRDIVVLHTYEYIKAALVDNGDTFSGRYKGLNYISDANNAGLFFIDGTVWEEQRSFVFRSLRYFGTGRPKSVEIIQEECVHLLEDLERLEGKSIDIFKFMSLYSINVMAKFVLNKRFDRGDRDFEVFEKCLGVLITKNNIISKLILMFPFIERNDSLMRFIHSKFVTSRKSLLDDCYDMFRNDIEEHSKRLDPNSEGDDVTDMFLIHQRRLQESSGNVKSFTDWRLIRNILELIGPGYDSAEIVKWSFLFMTIHPDIQDKVYEEISNKIGNDRLITAVDKMCLTYTQAVMDEILRLSSTRLDPVSVFHRTLNDVSVKGYYIPRDTLVIPNFMTCHIDPKTWVNPFEFRPERFLVQDDSGDLKYKPREELIAFGMGKRRCMGESVARMKYFIFFTSIIRRFRVTSPVKYVDRDVLHSSDGIIQIPEMQNFIFQTRS